MSNRRWLKECVCGKRYWGNNEDRACLDCRVKISPDGVKKCGCGCGKEFEYKPNVNIEYEKKYFNRACQMRARRRTKAGKAYMEQYNKRYKRVELEWVCQFPLCGKMVTSAHRRTMCDEHSNVSGHNMLLKKRRPEIAKSYAFADNLRKKVRRGTVPSPHCEKCGTSEDIHFHHPDYDKPDLIIPLCNGCHKEEHRNNRSFNKITQLGH